MARLSYDRSDRERPHYRTNVRETSAKEGPPANSSQAATTKPAPATHEPSLRLTRRPTVSTRKSFDRDDGARSRRGFTKFVDMAMTDEEKIDTIRPMPVSDMPEYPYGLRICLCENEISKLNVETDFQVGDLIDFRAMAEVTSVSSSTGPDGDHMRVELQIKQIARIENESTEDDYD